MYPPIKISESLWQSTWSGLSQRGQGRRESACVWAGERFADRWVVHDVVFLDDLPGVHGGRLHHCTTRPAVAALLSRLRSAGWQIVADVHTHPRDWVDLSPVDRQHPIEHRIGLVAIVLPHYGRGPIRLESVGVHEYQGSYRWRTLPLAETLTKIEIGGKTAV
jgi:proteasome lid subunit RPN8/RPN11